MEKDKSIRLLIATKKEYQDKLINILQKYILTYFKEIHTDTYKEFQKKLFKIPGWSDEKIDKEFSHFIKFTTKKFKLNNDDMSKILDIVFSLNLKIVTSIFDTVEVNVPSFKIFWYKCLKKITKLFYENPKLIDDTSNPTINNNFIIYIKYIIQKFIPIKDIINSTEKILINYNFDNDSFNTNNSSTQTEQEEEEQNKDEEEYHEKQKNEDKNDLMYINSEEFENEYYHSDKLSDKEEHKQINVPKKKK